VATADKMMLVWSVDRAFDKPRDIRLIPYHEYDDAPLEYTHALLASDAGVRAMTFDERVPHVLAAAVHLLMEGANPREVRRACSELEEFAAGMRDMHASLWNDFFGRHMAKEELWAIGQR